VDSRTGRVIAATVAGAFDSATRNKGLLGRDSMTPGSAIVIAPTSAIHTWFMRFDIDVAFVDRDGRIMKTRHNLRPWRVFGAFRAFAAIELPAGTLASAGVEPGDTLKVDSEALQDPR
jgi:uncharacterized membrane protein (UPF0127 family)